MLGAHQAASDSPQCPWGFFQPESLRILYFLYSPWKVPHNTHQPLIFTPKRWKGRGDAGQLLYPEKEQGPTSSILALLPFGWISLFNYTTPDQPWSLGSEVRSVQFSSVQSLSRTRLCVPMDCSMPGRPVLHQLPELTQTHVHWVVDAIQSSHSLSSFSSCPQSFPTLGSFPMSQLFASGGQSIGVSASASVLPVNTQEWSPLGWTGWISLQSKGLSRFCSNATVQKHQFFSTQFSLWSNSHIHAWLLEKP